MEDDFFLPIRLCVGKKSRSVPFFSHIRLWDFFPIRLWMRKKSISSSILVYINTSFIFSHPAVDEKKIHIEFKANYMDLHPKFFLAGWILISVCFPAFFFCSRCNAESRFRSTRALRTQQRTPSTVPPTK